MPLLPTGTGCLIRSSRPWCGGKQTAGGSRHAAAGDGVNRIFVGIRVAREYFRGKPISSQTAPDHTLRDVWLLCLTRLCMRSWTENKPPKHIYLVNNVPLVVWFQQQLLFGPVAESCTGFSHQSSVWKCSIGLCVISMFGMGFEFRIFIIF